MGTSKLSGKPDKMLGRGEGGGGNLEWTSIPSRRSGNIPSHFILQYQDKLWLCGPLGSCADFTSPQVCTCTCYITVRYGARGKLKNETLHNYYMYLFNNSL